MNISMNGALARPLALATALIITGCGGGSTDTAAPAVPARDLAGAVTKGPLDGAAVKIQAQAGGVATGPVLATATTDSAGRFTVPQFSPPAGASVLIVQACGGSFVDESDTGSPRRSILLASTDCLEAPLAVGAGSAVVTPYTAALLAKARNQFDGQGTYSFEQVFAAVQAQATQAFGFDPFTILPANPLAPTGTLAQIQYAMLLGGAAQAINAVAVSSGRLPQFSDVQAFVNDFSDGALDMASLTAETRRFRGNNAGAYGSASLPTVDETLLAIPAIVQTAPVATAQALTVLEDDPPTTITLAGTDLDGDALSFTVGAGGLTKGVLAGSGASRTYTPNLNAFGTDSFTFTVSDGTFTSAPATVTISITPVNDAPVPGADSKLTAEDTPISFPVSDLLGNDTDVDGDSLSAFAGSAVNGSFSLSGSTFTFVPAANFSGEATFFYGLSDASTTVLVPVTVTVTPVADTPEAFDDAYSVDEDATLEVAAPGVLDNDVDEDLQPLTATIVSGGAYATSTSVAFGGAITYVPEADFNGEDSFTYTATDGTLTSNTATVTITVNPVPDAPVALDDAYTVANGGSLTTTAGIDGLLDGLAPDFAGRDYDVDGDELGIVVLTTPSHAASFGPIQDDVTYAFTGGFTYTHDGSATLSDSFTYKVCDVPAPPLASLCSAPATVILTIEAGASPVAKDDSFVVGQGSTLSGVDVLSNDSHNGGTVSMLSMALPRYSTNYELTSAGILTYLHQNDAAYQSANAAEAFADSFMYEVCEGANCATATAKIYINKSNATAASVGGNWEFYTFDGEGLNGAEVLLYQKSSLSFLPGGVYLYGASLQLGGLLDLGCDTSDSLSSDVGAVVDGVQFVTGIEYGPYNWNPSTAAFGISQAPVKETDGACGFSEGMNVGNAIVSLVLSPFDNLITFIYSDHTAAQWTRTFSPTGELKGAFLVDGTLTSGDPKVFTFRPDAGGATGHYLMVDANANENAAESPGIEYGCYSITQDASQYWLTSTTAAGTPACGEGIDTNLEAGISGLTLAEQATFTVSGDDVTFANAAGPVGTLSRLPITADSGAAPPQASELYGTWEVESHQGMFITFLADGTYIKGGPELDAGCGGTGNEVDGNGYEQGTWSVIGSTLTTTVSVETDGDCGLGAGATSIAIQAAGQTLVLDATTNDPAYLHRVASAGTGSLVGAWYFAGADFANPEAIGATPLLFVFKADGSYTMVDTTADPLCDPPDGALGGIERGLYTHTGGQLTVSELSVDTNGDCGLSDFIGVATPGTVVFHGTDADRIQITQGADVAVLKRLSVFNDVDRDGDGVVAAHEARLGLSDTNADFDADGLKDGAELAAGSQPNAPDSDGDGFGDGFEVADGSNPAQALSKPAAAPANDFFAVSTSAAVGTVIPAPGVLLNDNRTYGSGLQAFEVAGSSFFQILPSGAVEMSASATAGDYTLSYQPKQSSGLPVGVPVTVRIHVSAATAATPPAFWYLPYHVDTSQGGGDYIVRSDDFNPAGRGTVVPRAGSGPALGYGTRLLSKVYFNGDTSIDSFLPDALVYARDGSLHWAGLRDIDSPSVPKRFTDESGAYLAALCDGDDSPFVTPLEFSGTGNREALYFYTLRDGAGDCTVHKAASTGASTSTSPTTLPGRVLSPIIDSDAVATVRGFVTLVPSTAAGYEETVDVRVYGPDFTTPLFNSLLGSNAGTTSVEVHTDLGHVLFETFAASSTEHYLRKLQVDLAPFSVGAQYSLYDLGNFKVEEVQVDGSQSSGHFYVLITQQEPSIQSKVLKIPRSATGTGSYEVYSTPLGSYVERLLLTSTYVVFNEKLSPESTAVLKVYPKAGGSVLNMDFTQSGSFFATPTHVFWTTYDGLSHQARYAAEAPVGGLETPFVDLGANTQFIGEVFQDSGTLSGQNLGESSSHVFMVDAFLGPGLGFSPSSLYALSTTPPIVAPALIGTFDGQLDADRYAFIGMDRPGIGLAPACRYDVPVECDLYAIDVTGPRFTRITATTALDEGTIDDDEVEVDDN